MRSFLVMRFLLAIQQEFQFPAAGRFRREYGRHAAARSVEQSPGPSPVPLALVVKNGSRIRVRKLFGMPGPRSQMEIHTVSLPASDPGRQEIEMCEPLGEA